MASKRRESDETFVPQQASKRLPELHVLSLSRKLCAIPSPCEGGTFELYKEKPAKNNTINRFIIVNALVYHTAGSSFAIRAQENTFSSNRLLGDLEAAAWPGSGAE